MMLPESAWAGEAADWAVEEAPAPLTAASVAVNSSGGGASAESGGGAAGGIAATGGWSAWCSQEQPDTEAAARRARLTARRTEEMRLDTTSLPICPRARQTGTVAGLK